jgi:hypothetical protein
MNAAQFRDLQVYFAGPGFISPVAVAITAVNAIVAALAVSGLAKRLDIHLHEPLQGVLQRLTNEICICPFRRARIMR